MEKARALVNAFNSNFNLHLPMNANAEKLKTEMLKWVWRWKIGDEVEERLSMTFEDRTPEKARALVNAV
jgi:hypothetical protein